MNTTTIKPPRGSYTHPAGGYITQSVYVTSKGKVLRVRAHHRENVDAGRLATLLSDIATTQAAKQREDGSVS